MHPYSRRAAVSPHGRATVLPCGRVKPCRRAVRRAHSVRPSRRAPTTRAPTARPSRLNLARDLPRMLQRPLLSLPRGRLAVQPPRHTSRAPGPATVSGQRPRGHLPVRSSRRAGTARRHWPAPRGCLSVSCRREPPCSGVHRPAGQRPRGHLPLRPCSRAAVWDRVAALSRRKPPRGFLAVSRHADLAVS
jgi:hypothetical protein